MKLKSKSVFLFTIVVSTLASCRQVGLLNGETKKDQDTSETPKGQSPAAQPASISPADAAIAKSPKMLLARVSVAEMNTQKSKIEMVSIDQTVAITSGAQAAQLFASGQPMQLSQEANGPQAANGNYTVLLGARSPSSTSGQSLALDGVILGGEPYISSSGIGYGPTPVTYGYGNPGYGTAGYGSPVGYGYGAGGFSIIDGICSLIGNVVGSISYTISSFLYYLNPLTMIGNIGIGYGGIGQYPYGGYQYYPYNPTGPYPNPQPNPNPNPNPNSTPQYPQQTYPNTNLPQQPGQPTPPTGQESMPLR